MATRLESALESALGGGDAEPLLDAIERVSGLPGPRPNLTLLESVGAQIARRRSGAAARLVEALLEDRREALFRVGLYAVAASGDRALERLHDLADEPVKERRQAVIDAVAVVVAALGGDAPGRLAAFMDGYLHAHVALEALTRPRALSRVGRAGGVVPLLEAAFDLADEAPRSADRLQGVRLLREGLPGQVARLACRFDEVVALVPAWSERERPETREVVAEVVAALRKIVGEARADRLRATLASFAKPPRDPSRIVRGTRKRSRGR
jgi:hypothetical protein